MEKYGNDHGTHVAGIAAGKTVDADGNVTFAGQSPEAQLAIFKVFSDSTNGASTDTILAALNDALLLDVDVINMSLGSNGGFGREAEGDLTTKYYDLVKASGILLNCSAGNSYSSSQGGAHGDFTSVSDPDTGIVSSSSSYDAALSVASVNANETAAFLIGEGRVPYNDVSGHSFTQLLLGKEAMEKLHNSRVAVFGIGGVGGYTVEALARSGVGALDLIDDDKVCLTNLNRQIVATRKTVGQYKVDVAEQRIHEIDPDIKVTTYKIFFTPETQDQFDFTQYDYVVDAIDTVTGKIALVVKAKEAGTPIICAMGAGNKMDPTRFEVTDIYKTSVCPLAKVMRTECRKRRIKHLKVVYSKEPAMTPIEDDSISCKNHCICPPGTQRKCTVRRSVPGSNAFVPSVAGLIIGGEVVKDLVGFVPMKG